jgi:hypothetical protein
MNKAQGILVGALIAAGLILRPAQQSNEPASETYTSANGDANQSQSTAKQLQGPWLASCRYWAPANPPDDDARAGETSPTESAPLQVGDRTVNINFYEKAEDISADPGCGSDAKRWGLPENADPINLMAIIATVPDPVHTHMAMEFDRAVDAILQAASDNGYVSSYFWLPWKRPLGTFKAAAASDDREPGYDPKREREPGLVILKNIPERGLKDLESGDFSSNSFHNVIYLFIVAETPTEGINGFQFQRAIAYESELEFLIQKRNSGIAAQASLGTKNRSSYSRGADGGVAIIGPMYSGSAASLRAGIETAREKTDRSLAGKEFNVIGSTGTMLSVSQLKAKGLSGDSHIDFYSFDSHSNYEQDILLKQLAESGYDLARVAKLIEDNTALGSIVTSHPAPDWWDDSVHGVNYQDVLVLKFPREISLLRNAEVDSNQSSGDSTSAGSVPSPYLHFSIKDSGAQDAVPQFSRDHTPLSQEAQLMTIARQLQRNRVEIALISASDQLDQIFLAEFLHRACPDTRLVFLQSDLLMVREVDNVPFIGSITVGPYSFMGIGRNGNSTSQSNSGDPLAPIFKANSGSRTYTDTSSGAYYNAARFTFWDRSNRDLPSLQGYQGPMSDLTSRQPPLWATTIGSDGYYPLGILGPCSSDQPEFLPRIDVKTGNVITSTCTDAEEMKGYEKPNPSLKMLTIYPSQLWGVLCILVSVLCLFHIVMLLAANYWSPFTRDLAIFDNDQPHRRSMYIHVATAMLAAMACVLVLPVVALSYTVHIDSRSMFEGVGTLCLGMLAVSATIWRSWQFSGWFKDRQSRKFNPYFWLDVIAWVTLIGLPICWDTICRADSRVGSPYFVGLSFSYRCINPGSGVSPVVPVLLLLLGWYLWSFFQTWRLRFARNERPWLPGKIEALNDLDCRYFVSDDELDRCDSPVHCCLYDNITCPLITQTLICRFFRWSNRKIAALLGVVYACVLILLFVLIQIRSVDHFLWHTGKHVPSPYEFLVGALSFPLMLFSLTGWLRLIMIWGSLRRGLLERLENQAIRGAFSRLQGMGWMTILRSGGLHGHWRDMARCIESMRQTLHLEDLTEHVSPENCIQLSDASENVLQKIREVRARIELRASGQSDVRKVNDPVEPAFESMKQIELALAEFGRKLLSNVLIPYWRDTRTGLVESRQADEVPIKARRSQMHGEQPLVPMELHAGPTAAEPALILAAEEFISIRYMSLIRAVLANMRYLITFVSATFVLAIMAWNSYPFQPRQLVNWGFTGLLLFLGSGVIWVLAQMHRNPILSRVTDTKANELGWDFYMRIASFGAIPVLTWMAYQFPDVAAAICRFLQPGASMFK